MKKLWYVALFVCIVVGACSSTSYPDIVVEPTRTFILVIAPTLTIVPTKLPTPTKKPQQTETVAPAIPKILLLGDSLLVLTRTPTYFSKLLGDAGITAEFVGDEFSSSNDIPADGLGGFDTGLMFRQLTSGTSWTRLNGTQFPNNFDENIPDIVVIQLGTNDAINASEGGWNPVPTYRKYMQKIIEFLRSRNPNVGLVVPMLIPSQWPEYTAKIDLVNSTIPDFVEMMDKPSSRAVTTANLKDIWEDLDYSDNVHPSDQGSQKIAQAYFDALVNNHLVNAP